VTTMFLHNNFQQIDKNPQQRHVNPLSLVTMKRAAPYLPAVAERVKCTAASKWMGTEKDDVRNTA
jgi:hypothetical protein